MTRLSIVIPAKAGIQLPTLKRSKLDPDFRQGRGGDARIKSAHDASSIVIPANAGIQLAAS
jgi:hypothetical protein